ncbi:trehalose 6-phosphate phosphatase [Thermobispora bispora]|jgi:trehalose 6-phosphate phosphatase|uniref:Trehalose 6-phosphate phosphatase n=1 Tax=Thermobispora bispora (strain ATCC 19993 / DSM 43833 / CBS 139.67 / JCM 10125 / KCTC 9307 / NBRC 14880 / R51) TaxID=469371 RepID=D6Y932_THEBD|nr:trehalose-phosphatase [Thermobispora bispora]ADG89994.1 trehalose-phosphatase [Thermobispora bispora DSM 43833]MBO2475781.1 trehalose-phosphatase [Actinomycetales bacterium]MDI9580396.1 trehalose-phosphatase [Thermobispora sp.]QSI46453.1 trehalose-phosphatase [Thermobispora bispora]
MRLPDHPGLRSLLGDPSGAVIGLDFDGTLSPIVPDPDAARIHPEAPEVLADLAPLVNAVVIITGRPPATALALGAAPDGRSLADVPGLVILGHYGMERWENGRITAPPPPPGLDAVRAELPAITAPYAGVHIEDKGRAVAVHTRRCPDPAAALAALTEPVTALAARTGLIVEPGRFVLELRAPGMDKGQALTAFLAERRARSVLFAGDDLGDLAAFRAVAEAGIPGVRVCSGSAEVAKLAAEADIVVDGPDGVVGLLRAIVAALRPDR